MTVQSLIFSKKHFTKAQAKQVAKRNNFKYGKIDETSDSYRLRQEEPAKFDKASFKTVTLKRGIKAITGKLKNPGLPKDLSVAIKKYLSFHHKDSFDIVNDKIKVAKYHIHIGDVRNIDYISDKFGRERTDYTHDLLKFGNLIVPDKPIIDYVIITGLAMGIGPEGLTG